MLVITLFLYRGGVKWFVGNDSSPWCPGRQELVLALAILLIIMLGQFYSLALLLISDFLKQLGGRLTAAGRLDISVMSLYSP